jgi:hypothetical protein
VTRRELLPVALVLLAIVFDAAGVASLAFYCLLAAVPAIVVAGLAAVEELLQGGALPHRRPIAMLHPVALVLILVAAALRAPLRAEGAVPRAAVSAAIACLVVFAIQGVLAAVPALKRVRPAHEPADVPLPQP